MMVFVNSDLFNSEYRGDGVQQMLDLTDAFTAQTGIKTYVTGMPYIRTVMSMKVKNELKFFTMLAGLICTLLLLLFFRSFKVTLVVMTVVTVAVLIAMGSIALFNYPITALMGLIPPLMIVTTVPNCIYLVTKYHQEYRRYGNKTRALARVVQKAGAAAFMINATTAVGFATFIFTSSDLLKHFGVIASLNCMLAFFLSVFRPAHFCKGPPTGFLHPVTTAQETIGFLRYAEPYCIAGWKRSTPDPTFIPKIREVGPTIQLIPATLW